MSRGVRPINIAFFNQSFLVQQEIASALRRLSDVRLIAIDIASHPTREQAIAVVNLMRKHGCRMLFTVNEWGLDADDIINEYIESTGTPYVNWCVDDPFYESIMMRPKYRHLPRRIDFVSDRDYCLPMRDEGYNAWFLPLASDLSLYPHQDVLKDIECSFVGNSYLRQIDSFSKGVENWLDAITPFLAGCLQHYHCDASFDIGREISDYCSTLVLPEGMGFQRATFIAKHIAGYLFRKRIVGTLIDNMHGFALYGDVGWETLFPGQTVNKVRYGEGLCSVYNRTKVNVDINRVVIRSGFTQRTFDALATGSFVITSAKPIVDEFFETEGKKREVVVFKRGEELADLAKYYCNHSSERESIARRGMAKVHAAHTYNHRIAELFKVVAKELG